MGNTKTTTAALAVIEPVRVELIIPEEIEINGLKISNKIIQDKIAEVKKIKINGIEDKENYALAVQKLSECVKLRTQSEAWRKEKVKPVLDGLSDLKAKIEGFGKEAQEGEDYLRGIIAPIDEAKLKAKQEKENEKLRVMQGRISEITALGAIFDQVSVYTFPYDPGLLINSLQLKEFDQKEFTEFLEEVKTSWVCEQERIANEHAEADRKAQEIADQAEQNKVQEKANQDKRTALRLKELKMMGMGSVTPDNPDFCDPQDVAYIRHTDVTNLGDDEWDILVNNAQEAIDNANLPKVEIHSGDDTNTGAQPISDTEDGFPFDELDMIGDATVPVDYSNMVYKCELRFETVAPFKEIDISKNFKIRLYPAELQDLNVVDPKVIATEGEIDPASSLRYMLIKK